MILNFPEPQYFMNAKKGDSVHFGEGIFKIQEDKGWLFIYPKVNSKRSKVDAKHCFCEPGSEADWVLNNWWQFYDDYEVFRSFILAELAWVKN